MGKVLSRALNSVKNVDKRTLANYANLIKEPIDEHAILLESQQGRTWNGNIFYILQYLNSDDKYRDFKLVFVSQRRNQQQFIDFLEQHGIDSVEVVPRDTERYLHLLSTSKYLITDTSFPTYFIKRDEQIMWNVWHGTPLKAMGRKDHSGVTTLGNVQKNLAWSDYLSFPSMYMSERMLKDYMIDKIYNGTLIFDGYPRNTVFFDPSVSTYNPENDEYAGMRRYAYMPTWRPLQKGYPKRYASAELIANLIQLDRLLDDDEVLFVNIHPLDSKNTCLTCFNHIKPFPSDVETYAFLNTCDALVTDYSSVFFDFAATRKPIILFTWDEEEYLRGRGMYMSMDELPFERVHTCDDLISRLRASYDAPTDEQVRIRDEFIEKFAKYESATATAEMCDKVILGTGGAKCVRYHDNGRENVIIYAGNMARNGITRSITDLMSYVHNDDERNYFLAFSERKIKGNADVIEELPDYIQYIPYIGKANMTFFQKGVQYVYGKTNKGLSAVEASCTDAYLLNLKKRFGFMPNISTYIQFNGYDYKEIIQYGVDTTKRRIIFMHNDMIAEQQTRGITRLELLKRAYRNYDCVAVVSDDLVDVARKISPDATVRISPNVFNDRRIRELATLPISFEEKTKSTHSVEELLDLLNDDAKTCIVTVGRFSPEKGHKRLFDALKRLSDNGDTKTHVIVIGGNSFYRGYDDELEYAQSLGIENRIVMIQNVSNPYAIMAKCDGFILPSIYEGFGLVLFEANVCGLPIVATCIVGPTTFMEQHNGCLVDSTTDGVYSGLSMLVNGEVPVLDIDYDEYNNQAVNAFYDLL